MNALYQRKLAGNGPVKESSVVQLKMEQDIAFLEHRISLMKQQRVPNKIVLETYETMLKSRQSVLSWLLSNNTAPNSPWC